ncbi:Acid protease [Mycena sanguinolenta]|uniref:Acid protease n=1 Tax=Mycena sanguinolenta TaxID=230812 RepID=A0A8H7DFB5_9AGAR|nr:Acid protease [Mycena sanguinolenta]
MIRLVNSLILLACILCATVSTPVSTPTVLSVPFRKKVSGRTRSLKALIARDLSRFSVDAAAAVGSAPATNEDDTYVVVTKIGAQNFELIVSTGSGNTWVGSGATRYVGGTTSSLKQANISSSGTQFTDTAVIAGLSISQQSFGNASRSSGFEGVDGVIGLGPVVLTEDTVSGLATVPTVLDNLFLQGTIPTEVLGVSFAPESGADFNDINGELTFGGTDSTKFVGEITFVGKTTTSPYSDFWGIAVTSITYRGVTIGAAANAAVDTGTTLIYIPTIVYNTFAVASGGKTDPETGLLTWTALPTANLEFNIGGVAFTLTPSQFTIPAAQYANFGLAPGKFYGWISDGGNVTANINFVFGQKFLENYYSVYDTTNNRLGLATRA